MCWYLPRMVIFAIDREPDKLNEKCKEIQVESDGRWEKEERKKEEERGKREEGKWKMEDGKGKITNGRM